MMLVLFLKVNLWGGGELVPGNKKQTSKTTPPPSVIIDVPQIPSDTQFPAVAATLSKMYSAHHTIQRIPWGSDVEPSTDYG